MKNEILLFTLAYWHIIHIILTSITAISRSVPSGPAARTPDI